MSVPMMSHHNGCRQLEMVCLPWALPEMNSEEPRRRASYMVMILFLGLTESEERKTTAIRVAKIILQPWAVKEKHHQRKERRLSH